MRQTHCDTNALSAAPFAASVSRIETAAPDVCRVKYGVPLIQTRHFSSVSREDFHAEPMSEPIRVHITTSCSAILYIFLTPL